MHNFSNSSQNILPALIDAQQDLIEYKIQAQEYEEELENEIKYKEAQIRNLSEENQELRTQISELKKRLCDDQKEISRLASENEKKSKEILNFRQDKRMLEDLNDYWEKSARVLEHSRQVLEEKLMEAVEKEILCKEELEVVSLKKEEEIQRLKDDFKEVKMDLSLKRGRKLGIQSAGRIAISSPFSSKSNSRKTSEISENEGFIKFFLTTQDLQCNEPIKTDHNTIFISNSKGKQKSFKFNEIWQTDPNSQNFSQYLESLTANRSVLFIRQSNLSTSFSLCSIFTSFLSICAVQYPPDTIFHLTQIQISGNTARSYKFPMKSSQITSPDAFFISTLKPDTINELSMIYLKNLSKKAEFSHLITTLIIKPHNVCVQFTELGCYSSDIKETLSLNKSLSTLEASLAAISGNQKYIPSRNSYLTRYLSQTLTHSAHIHFIIKPLKIQANELLSLLSVTTRIGLCSPDIPKSIKAAEILRTVNLLNNEHKEKQKLLILVDKLQKDLKVYEEFYKSKENADGRSSKQKIPVLRETNSCKLSPRHSRIPKYASKVLFSPSD